MLGRIDPKLPEVGRIRLGTKRRTERGKLVPHASDSLIFSSESKGTLLRLAEKVGGEVEAWSDGPDAWRVISTVASLAIQIVPGMLREPMFELWSAAGCLRRCDGETCESPTETPDGPVLVNGPCLCEPGAAECKMTTRVPCVIPQVPGLGVWILTTHSEIAGKELAGQKRLLDLSGANGLIAATAAIEKERTRRGSTVPVIRLRFHVGLDEMIAIGQAQRPELTA